MGQHISQLLGYRITSDAWDGRLGQLVCFLAGVLVLVLSLWKLTRLELTEAQLFFGVLLSLAVPLLFIVVGLLLPISAALRRPKA